MKLARRGAVTIVTALALAACGGESDSSDDAATEPTTEPATTEPTTESATTEPTTESATTEPTTSGPSGTPAPTDVPGDTAAPEEPAPTTAPAESVDELAAQAAEENTLVVYGNPSDQIWEPILAGFGEAYPFIEVETFDLGGVEAFQRYLTESASGVATADLLITSEAAGWLDLVDRGEVVDYVDANVNELPSHAVQAPGVYAMSLDPLVAMYNQFVVAPEDQPTTLAELAALAPDLPGDIGTVEIENSQAYTGNYGYIAARTDEAWATLEALGPHTRAESGTGALLGKATSGEYPASFFVSGAVRLLLDTQEQGDVLDYQYLTDATPLVPRAMGVPAGADSPASAKLLINWLLSEEGQATICLGGLTPYRSGVECEYGYDAIAAIVGEDNMIVVDYDPAAEAERDAIQSRWNEAFGR